MDPVSASLGIVGSLLTIADVVTRSVNRLSTLKAKYRRASLSVTVLLGQLCTIQAVLEQLTNLQKSNRLNLTSSTLDLGPALTTSLDACGIIIESVGDLLDQLEKQDGSSLTAQGKIMFLWHEDEIKDFLGFLDPQINALTLLLQVMQW